MKITQNAPLTKAVWWSGLDMFTRLDVAPLPPPVCPPPAPDSRVRLIRDTACSDSDRWLQVELSDSEEDDLTGRRNQSRGDHPPPTHTHNPTMPFSNCCCPTPNLSHSSHQCVCVCV